MSHDTTMKPDAWIGYDDGIETRFKAMAEEIDRLREFVMEVRRSGDTRLASMAISVLSVRSNEGSTPPTDAITEYYRDRATSGQASLTAHR